MTADPPKDPAEDPATADLVRARAFAGLDRLAGDLGGLGVALSGGGDSVALMHLAAEWARERGVRLGVATVDHGLRPDSAPEAALAGRAARALGLDHQILRWTGGSVAAGNLMANARQARLDLLSGWARAQGLGGVALGHSRDDLAETLLMRLARGAGIDGLAAMAARRSDAGMVWLRPLREIGRAELRAYLRSLGATWVDDPSNDSARFERVRARQAIAALGLDPAALALSATHLAEARDALNAALMPLVEGAQARAGALLLDRAAIAAAPVEQRRRLIVAAVRFVTGAAYPPRRAGVEHALAALTQGVRATLHGAVLDPGDLLLIHREPAAAPAGPATEIWDLRWRLSGLQPGDLAGPLAGDVGRFDWRSAGFTHLEAQALPAVRRGREVYAPALQPEAGLAAGPIRDIMEFRRILLGH